jgi:TRAP-type C4-dicarboxylate transport system permease small subunit
MYDINFLAESRILDWLVVFGYIGITVFIMWQVFNTKPR